MATRAEQWHWFNRLTQKKTDGGSGVSFSAEAAAVIALMDSAPTAALQGYIATLVDTLVASGDWSELDVFEIYGAGTEANALIDWKGLVTPTNPSATFNVNESFSATGTQKVLTGFTPSTDGVNYVLGDAGIGVMCLSNSDATDQRFLCGDDGTSHVWNQRTVANRLDMQTNKVTVQLTSYPNGWEGVNTYANTITTPSTQVNEGFVNGVSINTSAGAVGALAAVELAVLHRNAGGTGITGSVGAFYAGSNSLNHLTIHNALVAFYTSLGVIP